MNFIGNLLPVRKIARKGRLSLLIFLLLFFSFTLTLCSPGTKTVVSPRDFSITNEERRWLIEFFRDLLFNNDGAYTLFGTKPVSASLLEAPLTEEEKAQWRTYFESLSEEEKAILSPRAKQYDLVENYQKWREIKQRFPISQYLFGTFRLNDKTEILFFVNIEMTLRTLLEYYEDFHRVIGREFDPFAVVFEVEDKSSYFWNKVVQNSVLAGLILGYGRDNAWFFQWEKKYRESSNPMGNFLRSLPSAVYEERDILNQNPKQFMLPIFGSYGLHPGDTQMFEQYKKEHRQIKVLYRGRDEVDVALEWLTR